MIRVRLHIGDHCIAQQDVGHDVLDFRFGHDRSDINLKALHPHKQARIHLELRLVESGDEPA